MNEAQEELAQARALVRALDMGIADLVLRVSPDGTVLSASASAERVVERAPAELLNTDLMAWIHPDDRDGLLRALAITRDQRTPIHHRHRMLRGHDRWTVVDTTAGVTTDPGTNEVRELVLVTRPVPLALLARERMGRLEAVDGDRLSQLTDGVFRCDPDGYFTWVNEVATRVLAGDAPGGLAGHHYLEFVRLDHRERLARQYIEQKRLRTPVTYAEFPIVAHDGRELWVGQNVQVEIHENEVVGLIGVVRDITEHKRAEFTLRESESELRALVESISDVVLVLDRDGRYEKVVAGAPERLLRSSDELTGRLISDVMPAEDAERMLGWIRLALDTRLRLEREYSLRIGDRETWFECTITPATEDSVVWLARDVSSRKAAENALARSERRYRDVVDSLREVLFQLDDAARVVFLSAAWRELVGREMGEVMGLPLVELLQPEDRHTVTEALRAVFDGSRDALSEEVRVRHNDGSLRWVELRASVIVDDQTDRRAVSGTMHDITERKTLQGQLEQAQKMEAIGRLAGGVAHDFNNLLTAISANVQIARSAPDEALEEALGQISYAAERATELTRQLLAFGRKQVLWPRLLVLNDVVTESVKLLGSLTRANTRVVIDLADDVAPVLADPGQLGRVLMNLGVNALDAMPDGGVVSYATTNIDVDRIVALRYPGIIPGFYVRLSVRDSGVGMDAATCQRVFEPFFSTKAPGKGTGLGLSTVYGIVKQSGGYIYASSQPGKGSLFTIFLPRAVASDRAGSEARPAQPDVGTPLTTEGRPAGSETVLVVEDEPTMRSATSRILRRHGYTVLEAEEGGHALRMIDSASPAVSLVISDVSMPGLGGRELRSRLRERGSKVPLLFMSGAVHDDLADGDPHSGLIDKPFTIDSLVSSVRRMLDRAATG
jgi:PAS domain S-box-containing protein